ncbi:MAG TPA: oligosaccharide flippase family protein [Solirubrobacteraceae bacterium]|nr:oligosaccharide flippase family protein [Solirubrobacteraceae bacterium]
MPGPEGAQSPAAPADDTLSAQALRDATVSGVRWVMVTRIAAELGGLGASIVLARLIAPAEFGRAVIALVLPMLAVILTFEGFGSPLVQRRSLADGDLETSMLLSLGTGIGLTVATFALAPMATPLFGAETTSLAQLISPVFALAGAGTVSRAQLQRRLDFRRIGGYELTAFGAGLATSLALAFAGLEARALVLGPLVAVAVETVLMLRAAPPPRPRLRRDRVREILEFGLPATLAGLAYTARRNVDYVVLGARLGPTQVGIYWRAFQLGAEYQGKLSGIMLRVVFPVFSRASSLQDMQELRARVVRLNTAVVFPLLALLVVIAPVLVPWVYGPQWVAAVVPVQLLAVSGALLAVQSGSEPLALALGRPKPVLAFNVAVLSVYGVAVYIAAPHGLTTVCIVVVAVHAVMVVASQQLLLGRVAAMPPRALWREISPATAASGALLAVTVALSTVLEPALAPLPLMLVLGAAGGLVYAATLRALFPAAYAELRRVGRRLLGPRCRDVAPTGAGPGPAQVSAPDADRGAEVGL